MKTNDHQSRRDFLATALGLGVGVLGAPQAGFGAAADADDSGTNLTAHAKGGHLFLPGLPFLSFAAVAAEGYEIIHAIFRRPPPFPEGFSMIPTNMPPVQNHWITSRPVLRRILSGAILVALWPGNGFGQVAAQSSLPPTTALINGQWFNGLGFEPRTFYSVNGRFTSRKPGHVDQTIDLAGTYEVPPFGEAHNHNIGTGVEARDRDAIQRDLRDGVFRVKIMGNLPVSDDLKGRLGINRPEGIDVVFAQGNLTATDGHRAHCVGGRETRSRARRGC